MLTVTRDMILPTTITGSYPRPLWFDRIRHGEHSYTDKGAVGKKCLLSTTPCPGRLALRRVRECAVVECPVAAVV